MENAEPLIKEDYCHKGYRWFLLILLGFATLICSGLEIVSFKVYLDITESNGAAFICFLYFLLHVVISKISLEYQKKQSHHSLEYSEYQVPDYRSFIIAITSSVYYILICFMTPHLQSTHLVVLMQSSCVFNGGFLYFLHLTGWNWSRTCQFVLGFTSLILIILSLIINRRTCCPTIIIATILFILAVVLNSYATAFTAQTLLRFPSMQNEFEFYVYRYECYFSLLIVFVMFALRDPSCIQFADLFTFLLSIWNGLLTTFGHGTWIWLLVYILSGLLYDQFYSRLVQYSNAVFTSIVQVLAFIITLLVMWFYENSHSTPSHDILTIISFILFSFLLFWDGINLPVFRTHQGSFFVNKRSEDSCV
ncbi:hypothetical protein WA171_006969 [Blastocystis sp. BT1]